MQEKEEIEAILNAGQRIGVDAGTGLYLHHENYCVIRKYVGGFVFERDRANEFEKKLDAIQAQIDEHHGGEWDKSASAIMRLIGLGILKDPKRDDR